MGTISITTPSDGETADASDVNNPLNTIVTAINGNLDSNNISAGGITPANLSSSAGTSWAWQSWTPTFGNLSGGTLNYAKYTRIGNTVLFRWKYTLAGAGVGSGLTFTGPVASNGDYSSSLLEPITSTVTLRDDNAALTAFGIVLWSSSTVFGVRYLNGDSQFTPITSTAPWTWAANDSIFVSGVYETN